MTWPDDFINKVICADSLEVMKEIPDKAIDLVVTDPPYNTGKNYGLLYDDSRPAREWLQWCSEWLAECIRVAHGTILTPGTRNLVPWIKSINPAPKWVGAWYKPNQCSWSVLGGVCAWEPLVFYGNVRAVRDAWSVPIKITKELMSTGHPCPKNIDFWRHLVNCAPKDGIVLDPFLGTGTTAVAAKELGRRYIGIDIVDDYCKIAEDRLRQGEMQLR